MQRLASNPSGLLPHLRQAYLASRDLPARQEFFRLAWNVSHRNRIGQIGNPNQSVALFVLGNGTGGVSCSTTGKEIWQLFGIHSSVTLHDDLEVARSVERFEELIEMASGNAISLQWPLLNRGTRSSSRKISNWRHYVDALPAQASAMELPELLGAKFVAGNNEVANAFFSEVEELIFPRFRTQLDSAYLGGIYHYALRSLAKYFAEKPSSEGVLLHPDGGIHVPGEDVRRALVWVRAVIQMVHGLQTREDAWKAISSRLPWLAPLASIATVWSQKLQQSDDGILSIPRQEWMEWFALCERWAEEYLASEPFVRNEVAGMVLCGVRDAKNFSVVIPKQIQQTLVEGLQELANEESRVLSSRTCRYHLARIADRLVERVLATPSPTSTMHHLISTSRSLGCRGVLWELFASHTPSMDLYVRLCGSSPYLVQILLSNPGMIDDLLDSLMLESLPDLAQLTKTLEELRKSPGDPLKVTLAFRNAMHLAIGVRDILGKESVSETHRALSDVHEVCMLRLFRDAFADVAKEMEIPRGKDGKPIPYGLVVLGKFAAREPNYHSDASIVVVFDSEQPEACGLFFHKVAQRLFQTANRITGHGRLFELKPWDFSLNRSALLAWSTKHFVEYLESHDWINRTEGIEQRVAFLTARVLGDEDFVNRFEATIETLTHRIRWSKDESMRLIQWRRALEETASEQNIKRGWGGTLDVETLTHLFYAKHLHRTSYPWLRGTIERLEALRKNGILSSIDALQLRDAYYFLRGVESGLRLMNTKNRHDIPTDAVELSQLAFIIQLPDSTQLLEAIEHYRRIVESISQKYYAQFLAEQKGIDSSYR